MTYEELVEHIGAFPDTFVVEEHGSDPGRAENEVAAAMAQVGVAANIARATQDSLQMRVEIARARGATWTMIGNAIGTTAWRAEQRYFEKRPFGTRW